MIKYYVLATNFEYDKWLISSDLEEDINVLETLARPNFLVDTKEEAQSIIDNYMVENESYVAENMVSFQIEEIDMEV